MIPLSHTNSAQLIKYLLVRLKEGCLNIKFQINNIYVDLRLRSLKPCAFLFNIMILFPAVTLLVSGVYVLV